jgi:type I restriction enzyme M protein
MAQKRDILQLLSRDELLAVVDRFELSVADRRVKDGLVETIASSNKATLAEVLPQLSPSEGALSSLRPG